MSEDSNLDQELLPITRELIAQQLQSDGITCFVDDSGDVRAYLDDTHFKFILDGEHEHILCIYGFPVRHFSANNSEEISSFIESWHQNTVAPKIISHITDDGEVRIVSELAVNLGRGVTRAQLTDQMAFAVASTRMFMQQLLGALTRSE